MYLCPDFFKEEKYIGFLGAILGAIIGGLGSYLGSKQGANLAYELGRKKDMLFYNQMIYNQLQYSLDIFTNVTNIPENASNPDKIFIKKGTLIIEKNWKDSFKYLNLTTIEKKQIAEWLTFMEWSDKNIRSINNADQGLGNDIWAPYNSHDIGVEMRRLLPQIRSIAKKIKREIL